MNKTLLRIVICFLLSVGFLSSACAGLIAAGTRLIYTEGERERSLMLANTNRYPVIVQTWIDDGSGNPDYKGAPFVVLPPVFRLEPGEIKGVRIIYNQNPLPQDRESVAWLNMYEIPPSLGHQDIPRKLVLAMNTQMKIFYRPKTLPPAGQGMRKLTFSLLSDDNQSDIEVTNPTPYHVSFTQLTWNAGTKKINAEQQMDMMVAPFSKKRYRLLQATSGASSATIDYLYIDDVGTVLSGRASPGQ